MEKQIYSFRTPSVYPGINANDAFNELERIRLKYGELESKYVVEESKAEDSPLHSIFEWDDTEAAFRYRCEQARQLIKNIEVRTVIRDVSIKVRAIVNVSTSTTPFKSYVPLAKVVEDDVAYNDLLEQAKRDAGAFLSKYSMITEINKIKADMLEFLNIGRSE